MKLHHRPLFLFATAYVAGIIGASGSGLVSLGLAGCLLFVPVGAVLSGRTGKSLVIVLLGAFFTLGLMRTAVYRQVPADDISGVAEGRLVTARGRVVSDPEIREGRIAFVLSASSVDTYAARTSASGRAMVKLYVPGYADDSPHIPGYGEEIAIRGRLSRAGSPSNEGDFDYADYLARQRIYSTLTAPVSGITVIQPGRFGIRSIAYGVKKSLRRSAEGIVGGTEGKLLSGILLGDYASLPGDVQASFMSTGTMHLLAASGFNCGLIIGIFGWLLYRLTTPRAWRHVVLICLLWGFTLMVGAGPSIVRASLMASLFLSAYLLRRAGDMLNTVLLAGLVILVASPLSLYDVGFQLSFGAVLAIVIVVPVVEPAITSWFKPDRAMRSHRPARWLLWAARTVVLSLVVSVAALLGTWPITAYHFNYFSLVSVAANAITALLVVMLTGVGLAALFIGTIVPPLQALAAAPAAACGWVLLRVVDEFARFPYASVSVKSPSTSVIMVYYVILFGVAEYVYRSSARKTASPASP